jgi:hypothetical protein
MMKIIIAAWFFLLVLAVPVLAVTEEEITSNLNCPDQGGCTMIDRKSVV